MSGEDGEEKQLERWPKHPETKRIQKRDAVLLSLMCNLRFKSWEEGLKENTLRSLCRYAEESFQTVKDCEHQKLVRTTNEHRIRSKQLKELSEAYTRLAKHECGLHVLGMRQALLPLMEILRNNGNEIYSELLILEACSGETVAPTVAMALGACPMICIYQFLCVVVLGVDSHVASHVLDILFGV